MRYRMPIMEWLPAYQRSWLRGDLIAGATVWAVLIPIALAFAGLVGVDPVVGLYTVPLALLGYAVFGASRLFVVGPDAAVAVLSASIVAGLVAADDYFPTGTTGDEYLALTVALALIVGVMYLLFFLLKMGWIADLIPDPVLKGFMEGVVWVTILKQLPALLGLDLEGKPQGFFHGVIAVTKTLPEAHWTTALVGVSSVVVLWLVQRFVPRLPGPLVVLAGCIILVEILGLDKAGVAVLGEVKAGLPDFGLVAGLDAGRIIDLIPGALAIVVLGYTKSLGALKRAAEQSGQPVDPDQALLAIGVSNIGAGLGGGYAVAGSLPTTAVNLRSGAKTQISNLFAGILCVRTIVFLLPVFANLAFSSLAAIVVVALAGLSNLGFLRSFWAIRRYEFMIAAATFLGVLAFDVMAGVMVGVVLSLFELARDIRRPTTGVVGRTPSGAFVDIDEHAEAQEIPGMLILRPYAPLVFLNARVLSYELRMRALSREDIRVVVLDATASSAIDSTAANALNASRTDLAAAGITFWVANVRKSGWKTITAALAKTGAAIPPVFKSLADAVAQFEQLGAPENGSDD